MRLKTSEFKQLYSKRDLLENSLNTFVKFIVWFKTIQIIQFEENQISELDINVQRVENVLSEFFGVQKLIEIICNVSSWSGTSKRECSNKGNGIIT